MSRYSDHDSYLDPVSGILRNRLGILDVAALEATEASFAALRSTELALAPLIGSFNLAHLQAIHRYLFGDLYEWAGQLRTVDISKNNNLFAHHAYIENAAKTVFDQLAQEKYLVRSDPDRFCARAAYYFAEINAIHPFREGNGRTQREFLSHLACAAGYYIAWERVEPKEILEASKESFKGNLSRLTTILRGILLPLVI